MKYLTKITFLFALFASLQIGAQTVDCFIKENGTKIDVYVVANGGSFLTEQWNDMVITLSVPIAGADLGLAEDPPDNVSTSISNFNSYNLKNWELSKQPSGTQPSFSSASRDYYTYVFAGVTSVFEVSSAGSQDATLPENTPVLMTSIEKNGNAFADIEIYANSATETDQKVIDENAEFYIEIGNLEKSGSVSKEDIIHLNNRLNEPPTTPDPVVWKGGSDASAEADQTDGSRSLTIYSGPVQKTVLGSVASTIFKTETDIIIQPNGGLETGTITKNDVADTDSIKMLANASGDYGQYIGPAFDGSIQQFTGTAEGWKNVAFPIQSATITTGNLDLGNDLSDPDPLNHVRVPIDGNASSTSYWGSGTPDICGSFGGAINTVNIYEFLGSGGAAGVVGDHEWYGAGTTIGGNSGYSVFAGGTNFPTTGIFEVKGTLQDETVADYVYTYEAPHSAGATGASQGNYSWNSSCSPAPEEQAADRKANWDGWVLVANPFPCGLDVDQFVADNNDFSPNDIRIWDNDKAFAINGSGGIDYQYVALEAGDIIPPMQAFFIKKGSAGGTVNIQFTDAARAFATADFTKTSTINDDVFLIALNNADSTANYTILDFDANATDNYDQALDSYVLSQPGNTRPQIAFHYTQPYIYNGVNHQVVSPLMKNVVNTNIAQGSYPLRFWSRSSGNYTFMLDEDRLMPGWKVYIEDKKVAPGVSKDITNTPYRFAYDMADSPLRFELHFVNTTISIDENDVIESWNIKGWFDGNGDLKVAFNGYEIPEDVDLIVMDVSGKLLYNGNINTGDEFALSNAYTSGIYMIKVQDSAGVIRTVRLFKGQ